jgi:hypothetical protein
MNKWLKVLLVVLQIGGGLLGLGLIGRSLWAGDFTSITLIIHGAFAILFVFGILAGVALITKPMLGLVMSLIFQGIQIPIIVSPVIAYNLLSGALFSIYWHETGWGSNWGILASRYYFSINSGEPWYLGINILALVLFVLLIREIWLEAAAAKIPDSEIPQILSRPVVTGS